MIKNTNQKEYHGGYKQGREDTVMNNTNTLSIHNYRQIKREIENIIDNALVGTNSDP